MRLNRELKVLVDSINSGGVNGRNSSGKVKAELNEDSGNIVENNLQNRKRVLTIRPLYMTALFRNPPAKTGYSHKR